MSNDSFDLKEPAEGRRAASGEKRATEGTLKEGQRLYRLRRWGLALQEFLLVDAARLSSEDSLELSYYLGLCYTKLEQYEDAILHLEQVVTAPGTSQLRMYQCRMMLAYVYVMTKRTKLAEFELHRLASGGLESAQLYSTLAYAAWSQKHYKKAVAYYEKALEFDANNATALNGMGYILVDAGLDLIRGLRCCKKAVDLKPQRAAYLDSLGWAYYKSGELIEARTWLRRALEAAPDSKEIKDHLRLVTGEA
uniref:TPR domain protein n=1 Tax=uncultured bacterium contig00033 TaxID=1181522 RepID=A0A806K0B0_9BACT|nr:TPR domain protein [uncultured bacterium contig00033]